MRDDFHLRWLESAGCRVKENPTRLSARADNDTVDSALDGQALCQHVVIGSLGDPAPPLTWPYERKVDHVQGCRAATPFCIDDFDIHQRHIRSVRLES